MIPITIHLADDETGESHEQRLTVTEQQLADINAALSEQPAGSITDDEIGQLIRTALTAGA